MFQRNVSNYTAKCRKIHLNNLVSCTSGDKIRSTSEVRIDALTVCETHRIRNLEICVRERAMEIRKYNEAFPSLQ